MQLFLLDVLRSAFSTQPALLSQGGYKVKSELYESPKSTTAPLRSPTLTLSIIEKDDCHARLYQAKSTFITNGTPTNVEQGGNGRYSIKLTIFNGNPLAQRYRCFGCKCGTVNHNIAQNLVFNPLYQRFVARCELTSLDACRDLMQTASSLILTSLPILKAFEHLHTTNISLFTQDDKHTTLDRLSD